MARSAQLVAGLCRHDYNSLDFLARLKQPQSAGLSLELSMWFKTVFLRTLVYIRDVLLAALGICLFVALTFFFTKNFTFLAYSERVFWAGLITTLLGGLVAFAAMFSGRSFGIPTVIRKPEEAKNFLDHFEEYIAEVNKRHDVSIRLFIIGVGCIVISALIQTCLA